MEIANERRMQSSAGAIGREGWGIEEEERKLGVFFLLLVEVRVREVEGGKRENQNKCHKRLMIHSESTPTCNPPPLWMIAPRIISFFVFLPACAANASPCVYRMIRTPTVGGRSSLPMMHLLRPLTRIVHCKCSRSPPVYARLNMLYAPTPFIRAALWLSSS